MALGTLASLENLSRIWSLYDESRSRNCLFQMGRDVPDAIDVDKSSSHHLSHCEIAGDNPCSRHLSGNDPVSDHGFIRSFDCPLPVDYWRLLPFALF